MYLHEDDWEHISLHDCQAHRAVLEDGVLTLHFPDGVWVLPGHPANAAEDAHRTDAAEVRIPLYNPGDWKNAISMYVFSREDEDGECTRKRWKAKKLLDRVSDDYRMEVVCMYTGGFGALLKGYLWFDKKPYSKEYELEINSRAPVICWNELTDESF